MLKEDANTKGRKVNAEEDANAKGRKAGDGRIAKWMNGYRRC
jgi:hypothetical protein